MSRLTFTALLLTISRTVFAAIQITSSPFLPSGKVGQPYSFTFTASGGANPSWSIAAGSPPQGVILGSDGTLTPEDAEQKRAELMRARTSSGPARPDKASVRQLGPAAAKAVGETGHPEPAWRIPRRHHQAKPKGLHHRLRVGSLCVPFHQFRLTGSTRPKGYSLYPYPGG